LVTFYLILHLGWNFLSQLEVGSMNKAGAPSGGGGGAASGPTASFAAAAAQKQRGLLQRLDNDISNIVDSFSLLVSVSRVRSLNLCLSPFLCCLTVFFLVTLLIISVLILGSTWNFISKSVN
jgi:hypothetical protein